MSCLLLNWKCYIVRVAQRPPSVSNEYIGRCESGRNDDADPAARSTLQQSARAQQKIVRILGLQNRHRRYGHERIRIKFNCSGLKKGLNMR